MSNDGHGIMTTKEQMDSCLQMKTTCFVASFGGGLSPGKRTSKTSPSLNAARSVGTARTARTARTAKTHYWHGPPGHICISSFISRNRNRNRNQHDNLNTPKRLLSQSKLHMMLPDSDAPNIQELLLIPDDVFSELLYPGTARILELDTQWNRSSSKRKEDVYADDIFRSIHAKYLPQATMNSLSARMYDDDDLGFSSGDEDSLPVGSRAFFGQLVTSNNNLKSSLSTEYSTGFLIESIVTESSANSFKLELRGVGRFKTLLKIPNRREMHLVPVTRIEDAAIEGYEDRVKTAELEWLAYCMVQKLVDLEMRIRRIDMGLIDYEGLTDSFRTPETEFEGYPDAGGSVPLGSGQSSFADSLSNLPAPSPPPSTSFLNTPVSAYFLPSMVHVFAPKEYDRSISQGEWDQTPPGIRRIYLDRAMRFSFAVLDMVQERNNQDLETNSLQDPALLINMVSAVETTDVCYRLQLGIQKLKIRIQFLSARLAILQALPSSGDRDKR